MQSYEKYVDSGVDYHMVHPCTFSLICYNRCLTYFCIIKKKGVLHICNIIFGYFVFFTILEFESYIICNKY